jgi:hypothetical protein
MTLSKFHGGTKLPRTLNRGAPKPEATTTPGFHGGSGMPKGVLHEAPATPMVNDQNYAAQKIRRK